MPKFGLESLPTACNQEVKKELIALRAQLEELIAKATPQPATLPKWEVSQLERSGGCFVCGQGGHWVADCQSNPCQGRQPVVSIDDEEDGMSESLPVAHCQRKKGPGTLAAFLRLKYGVP